LPERYSPDPEKGLEQLNRNVKKVKRQKIPAHGTGYSGLK
jgi:hypothetical protein